METWLYKDLNHAARTKDKSKIHTLGPYAWALATILNDAEYYGRPKDPKALGKHEGHITTLYRGLKLTKAQL